MFFLTDASAGGTAAMLHFVPNTDLERRVAYVSELFQIGEEPVDQI